MCAIMCFNASFHFLHAELGACNANQETTHSVQSSYHYSHPLIMMFKKKMNKMSHADSRFGEAFIHNR